MICTSIENIKPGIWFTDGLLPTARRMIKIQDVLPSGISQVLMRVIPETGEVMGSYVINAIDDKGCPCSCPYNMEMFWVKNQKCLQAPGPTIKHVFIKR